MTLLAVSGLHKRFGGLHAVNDVSFNVEAGSINRVNPASTGSACDLRYQWLLYKARLRGQHHQGKRYRCS